MLSNIKTLIIIFFLVNIIFPLKSQSINNIEMVNVQGGSFIMGCTGDQGGDCPENAKPAHIVSVSDFAIGKYEITVEQFAEFVKSTGYKTLADIINAVYYYYPDGKIDLKHNVNWYYDNAGQKYDSRDYDHPAVFIGRDDAIAYCYWLSKSSGKLYRLPTEAEWEFAARGGNNSMEYKYSGSNNIEDVAWCFHNSKNLTNSVGLLQPNELGIYDMTGNVLEWSNDYYDDYNSLTQSDPSGPLSGNFYSARGSCMISGECVAARFQFVPLGNNLTGFRVLQSNLEKDKNYYDYFPYSHALRMYNYGRPDLAETFYDGDNYLLKTLIYNDLCDSKRLDSCIRLILTRDRDAFNSIHDNQLDWFAEKNGNFAIAKEIFELYKEKNLINIDEVSAYTLNYAHALLMTGEVNAAISIYKAHANATFDDGRRWVDEIINDFGVFRWNGIDDKNFKLVEQALHLSVKQYYTTKADVNNKDLNQRFAGKWLCNENGNSIFWEISEENNMSFYVIYDAENNLQGVTFDHYRFSKQGKTIYLEEYNPRTSLILSGSIYPVSVNEIILSIIDNGVMADRGKTMIFRRID